MIVAPGNKLKLKKLAQVKLNNDDKTTWLYFKINAELQKYAEPELTATGRLNDYKGKTALDSHTVNSIIDKRWFEKDHAALIRAQGWSEADVRLGYERASQQKAMAGDQIYLFRKRAAIFGYNASKK